MYAKTSNTMSPIWVAFVHEVLELLAEEPIDQELAWRLKFDTPD